MVFRRLNMKTKRKNYSKELKVENCSAAEHMANTKGALINKNKRKRADISEPGMSDKIQDQVFQRPQSPVPSLCTNSFQPRSSQKARGCPSAGECHWTQCILAYRNQRPHPQIYILVQTISSFRSKGCTLHFQLDSFSLMSSYNETDTCSTIMRWKVKR